MGRRHQCCHTGSETGSAGPRRLVIQSLIILDYIRHYGEDGISGINFIGGITKLGSDEATAVLGPDFLSLVPGFFATDVEEIVRSLDSLLRMCYVQKLSAEDRYLMLGYNLAVPPYVRRALFTRSLDNDDLLPRIRKPVLLTQGDDDAVVKASAVDDHKVGLPHAQVHMMSNSSHAPFWDDAAGFNQRLRQFSATR